MLPRTLLITSGIIVGATLSSVVALAWTGPTGTAPGNNVSAPLNVSTTNQVKNGGLSVNALSIFGSALLSGLGVGTGSYLNFDYTSGGTSGTGAAGYGIRDNAGTMEFKNLGGSWANLTTTIQSFFSAGNTVSQIKFSDGTVQTSAASTIGISASTVVTVSATTLGVTGACPSGYYVTGCAWSSSGGGTGSSVSPTGGLNGSCRFTSASGAQTGYLFCAK